MSNSGAWLTSGSGADPLIILRSDFWGYNSIGIIGSEAACAVDPGVRPVEIVRLRRSLETRRGLRPVSEVVLTHSHHDHIRGWRAFPGARICMPRIAAEKPEEARRRILSSVGAIDGHLGVEVADFVYPQADEAFADSLSFDLGDCPVELRFLPGHSNCTSVVYLPSCKTLLTADYLVMPGLPYCRWEVEPFETALRTMDRWCVEWGVDRIVPAHNAVLEGPAVRAAIAQDLAYFADLREVLSNCLADGAERETAVRRAAKTMGERRGRDVGGRRRQDLDNARRVLRTLEE
ncbi:MAG: MBL fold metallo-hydrolase [Planctomycetota bacterium]|nr:MBL fold metallo-hydrolase [Planctomycetota bacterium]